MHNQPRMKPIHSGRLERWLGSNVVEKLSRDMRGWYGPPINLRDVPGSVWVGGDGDFYGEFNRGSFASAVDGFRDFVTRAWDELGRHQPGVAYAGFSSISDALQRASQGYGQNLNGNILKAGSTGVVNIASTLWRVGSMPFAGGAASAAPDGRALTSSTTGAMVYTNPSSGTLHLTGADFGCNVINNSIMVYDRIFDVAKTMNSTANESVTGVPTRYQSNLPADPNYAGGNFLFMEVGGTALAGTAHNWANCLYRNQAGTDNQLLPSVTGRSAAAVDTFDMPSNRWWAPLASGDVGVMDLAQMACSALVATGVVNFVIGHPIAIMVFPVIPCLLPFDWLTNRNQAPRIFDDAALALIEMPKPTTTATIYSGQLYACSAAP